MPYQSVHNSRLQWPKHDKQEVAKEGKEEEEEAEEGKKEKEKEEEEERWLLNLIKRVKKTVGMIIVS